MTAAAAWRALRRCADARSGAAAVEFAIVLPILAALLIGVIQYGGMIIANEQMHNSVSSGAIYVMRGGTSSTAIHDVAVSAWANKPTDAAITVTQVCTCAGVAGTCSSLCADGTYPQSSTTISATGTYAGLWGNTSMSSSQTVRTQ
jgi:Flp pilus assembly protein TadG